jgi:hypothetical protein
MTNAVIRSKLQLLLLPWLALLLGALLCRRRR